VSTPPAQPGPAVAPAQPAQVVDLAAQRARRRRGLIAGGGILLAAAAAIAVFVTVNLTAGTTGGEPTAGSGPLAVSSDNLGDALDDALGATDYGPLSSTNRLEGCLAANGVGPTDAQPVGAREVSLDGRPGILIVLPAAANPPRWRLLVVGPECGPNQAATLADSTTG
jgi:hypothetical protein